MSDRPNPRRDVPGYRLVLMPEDGYAIEMWPYQTTPPDPPHEKVYAVDFVVRTLYAWDDVRMYQRADSDHSPDPVADIEQADWLIEGGLKWDGCVNYTYNQACALHACSLADFDRERRLWQRIYDEVAAMMPETADWR